MPRCDSCSKFVSLESDEDPEVDSAELSFSTTADFDVDLTINNTCTECSDTLKTAQLNISGSFDIDIEDYPENQREEWFIEVEDLQREEKSEGIGRGAKKFYGASCNVVLYDSDKNILESTSQDEYVQASHMDDA